MKRLLFFIFIVSVALMSLTAFSGYIGGSSGLSFEWWDLLIRQKVLTTTEDDGTTRDLYTLFGTRRLMPSTPLELSMAYYWKSDAPYMKWGIKGEIGVNVGFEMEDIIKLGAASRTYSILASAYIRPALSFLFRLKDKYYLESSFGVGSSFTGDIKVGGSPKKSIMFLMDYSNNVEAYASISLMIEIGRSFLFSTGLKGGGSLLSFEGELNQNGVTNDVIGARRTSYEWMTLYLSALWRY